MLHVHIKFRENRLASSGEEDFLVVFTIYGRGGHLGHVTQILRSNFRSLLRLHFTIRFSIGDNVNVLSPSSKTRHTNSQDWSHFKRSS